LEHPKKSLAPATARLIDDDSPFRQPKRLTREDFALYRGYLDGVELSQLHTRYSPFTDLRRTRAHLAWLRDALSIAARRAQDPAAARLLRLRPGSLSRTDEDKVISTASVHKGATSAHTAPDLEVFREETDPDGFYSEAELLDLYAAAFPIERAHHHDKRRSRRHRLRERQVAALARLEFTLAELPDRSHALNTWFEPALAKRLEAAGLALLADLLALIERYRWRWYVQVPRIGPKTAARISTWLAANSQSLRCEISLLALVPRRKVPADHADLVRSVPRDFRGEPGDTSATLVVPLEALHPPSELDGTRGTNRAPKSDNCLAATSDLAAIREWLATHANNRHTSRAYRREAERVVLWALIEKLKSFSSLTAKDTDEYLDSFLRDPQPAKRWVGERRVERFDVAWRPFDGPLSERSRETARSILRSLCAWLVASGYLAMNPFANRQPLRPHRPFDASGRTLTHAQWGVLLMSVESAAPSLRKRRDQCALLVAYTTGLRREELASLTVEQLSRGQDVNGHLDDWQLTIGGADRDARTLSIPSEVMTVLHEYFIDRELPSDLGKCLPGTPLLTDARGVRPLTAHGLTYVFKKLFERAASTLVDKDPAAAERLRRATTQWLRHSYAAHVLDSGVALRDLQVRLGHARLATTAAYKLGKRAC
jgi:site-specific recombinase XerD